MPLFCVPCDTKPDRAGRYISAAGSSVLDRFMFNLWLDYPSMDEEIKIVQSTTGDYSPSVRKVVSGTDILYFQELG